MDTLWYTSTGGIVAATIILVEILKRFAGNWPWFGRVPTWLYAVAMSAGLTVAANLWWHTLTGDVYELVTQVIVAAALASGFKEWSSNATKPLSASTSARTARGE